MATEPPFDIDPEMLRLTELMDLRHAASQAFPDSDLQPVQVDAPTVPDNPLEALIDQYFGYGRPQVPLGTALEELTTRGYTKLQVACFLLKKSTSAEIDMLAERYRVPRIEVKKVLEQAIGCLLGKDERLLLATGMMLGSYAALGISPDNPEFPGQLPLE